MALAHHPRCDEATILAAWPAGAPFAALSVRNMTKPVFITVELDQETALALAQFVKRVGWSDIRGNAVDDDEAYAVRDGLAAVAVGLQQHGFAPR